MSKLICSTFVFIMFGIFARSLKGSEVTHSTDITTLKPVTSSKCTTPIVCKCPDGKKLYNIEHVENCTGIKDICALHVKDNCKKAMGLIIPLCNFFNPGYKKGRPNVTSRYLNRNIPYEGFDRASLPCKIQSNPQARVRWLFNGTDIKALPHFNGNVDCNSPYSILNIFSIKYKTNHGQYTCVATNNMGQSNWTFTMTVNVFKPVKPDIVCSKKNIAYWGASFNISCRVHFPPGGIYNALYKRQGLRYEDDSRHTLLQEGKTFKMIITNVTLDDAGEWEFRAIQYPTFSSKIVKLSVVACPRGYYCPLNESTPRKCPIGSYNDGRTNVSYYCQRCPGNVTTNNTLYNGATSIEECPTQGPLREVSLPHRNTNKPITWIIVLIVIVIVIAVVVMVLLWVKYRHPRRRHKSYWQAEHTDETDMEKIYDVFISFSEKDYQFAKTLQSEIETQGFKCCFHHRDFLPGENIVKNIADAIYQSTVTLVVLSPNYLNSKFCVQELDQALTAAMTSHHVLPVKYESCRNVPKQIRSCVTYIEYRRNEERQFWAKLFNALKSFCGESNKQISRDSEV